MARHRPARVLVLAAGAMALTTMVSACSGGSSSSSGSGGSAPTAKVSRDAALSAVVPAADRGRTFTVAVTVFQPYDSYGQGSQIVGLDPDLYQALGTMLGIRFRVVDTSFDSIVPGIEAGRYQFSSPLGDFVERQRTVTFVDYAEGASSLLTSSSASYRPRNTTQLCGHALGIEKGSAEMGVTATLSQRCRAAGHKPVSVNVYPDLTSATLAVRSGRVDGVLADAAANGYVAKQSDGAFTSLPLSGGSDIPGWGATFGMALSKGSPLAGPIRQAIAKLASDGVYRQLFARWGMTEEMIPAADIRIDGSTAHQGG